MKKMRGFVDPITLGFLIIAIGAGAAATKTSNTEKQLTKQNSQPVTQVQAKAKQRNSSYN